MLKQAQMRGIFHVVANVAFVVVHTAPLTPVRSFGRPSKLRPMSTITFDTLKFANTLKAAGVPDKQAEAQAQAMADVLEVNIKDLVTKDDLQKELLLLEQRLVIKLGAIVVVAVGAIAALVKLA